MRARFISYSDGRFSFRTILPSSYPVPTDGPIGELIRAAGRHAMRPAHVHFLVDAPGYQPLVTHVFIDGDEYLHSDAVFGVKPELVATIAHHHEPVMPDGKPANGPWHVMTYHFQMNPGSGAVPKPLMPAAVE
jgi:protocatechuate 3,4-dioxygenase beta subunit